MELNLLPSLRRLITIVCKYLLDLKLLSADAIVTQARSFVHAALQKWVAFKFCTPSPQLIFM